MGDLNKQLQQVNQTTEGFHPSLFEVNFNFKGVGDLPKVMKALTSQIFIVPRHEQFGIVLNDNKIDICFSIDTTSDEFKLLLKYLLELKGKTDQEILGSISICYYSKNGTIFYKRILHDIKFNKNDNTFDIFDSLRFDAEPIHELEASFTFEKMEHSI